MTVKEGETVADIGTGCGILGIIASKKAERVFAIDINPFAILCAKENAKSNHTEEKMFFMQGDLFSPFRTKERFDLILFNAPYLPSERTEDRSWLGRAWDGGPTGGQIINRFIQEAPKHLRRSGRILLMQSTLSSLSSTFHKFEEKGLGVSIVAELPLPFFETVVLLTIEF
jgi:release factor glutamine methyltransferase